MTAIIALFVIVGIEGIVYFAWPTLYRFTQRRGSQR